MELPTVRQLECIAALGETLNFSRAAERCFITQPALSAQVKQLETNLGVDLFERDRRRVMPTTAGHALVKKARAILADLKEFNETAKSWGAPFSGTLRMGVIPTVAPYFLPQALQSVRRRFPGLRLLLHEGQTDDLLKLLGDASLDLAVLALEADLGDVVSVPLYKDPFLLAVPQGHRLAGRKRANERDLVGETILLLDDGHCLRDQALSLCGSAGTSELGDFRASSLTTLVQMVSGGVGVTLLPEMAVSVEAVPERKLELIPFGRKDMGRTIGLAWRKSSMRAEEYRVLGQVLGEAMGAKSSR